MATRRVLSSVLRRHASLLRSPPLPFPRASSVSLLLPLAADFTTADAPKPTSSGPIVEVCQVIGVFDRSMQQYRPCGACRAPCVCLPMQPNQGGYNRLEACCNPQAVQLNGYGWHLRAYSGYAEQPPVTSNVSYANYQSIAPDLASNGTTPASETAQPEGEKETSDGPTIEGVLKEINKVKDAFFSVYVDETQVIHDRLTLGVKVRDPTVANYYTFDELCDIRLRYVADLESRGVTRETMSKDDWITQVLQFCPLLMVYFKNVVLASMTNFKKDVVDTRGIYEKCTEDDAKRQLQNLFNHILSDGDCDIMESFQELLTAACNDYCPLLTSVVYYRAFMMLVELIIKHIVSCDSPEDMKKRVKEVVANGYLLSVLDEESKVLAEGKVNLPQIEEEVEFDYDEETKEFLDRFFKEGHLRLM